MRPGEIEFSEQEWCAASDLAAKLLEALGPMQNGCCEKCNPPKVLWPNYSMKYELAKALFKVTPKPQSPPTRDSEGETPLPSQPDCA